MPVVYTHTLDGFVFYVGKSINMVRPFDFKNRSDLWKNYTKGRSPEVKIVYEGGVVDVNNEEIRLIKKHKLTSVNKSHGHNPINRRHKYYTAKPFLSIWNDHKINNESFIGWGGLVKEAISKDFEILSWILTIKQANYYENIQTIILEIR